MKTIPRHSLHLQLYEFAHHNVTNNNVEPLFFVVLFLETISRESRNVESLPAYHQYESAREHLTQKIGQMVFPHSELSGRVSDATVTTGRRDRMSEFDYGDIVEDCSGKFVKT